MNSEKFTTRSQELIKTAVNDAIASQHQYITALHLLKAMLDENDNVVEKIITQSGGNIGNLKNEVNVAFAGDETDEEILGYDDWYWVFADEILPAPTLWDLCDFLSDYIDDVQE